MTLDPNLVRLTCEIADSATHARNTASQNPERCRAYLSNLNGAVAELNALLSSQVAAEPTPGPVT